MSTIDDKIDLQPADDVAEGLGNAAHLYIDDRELRRRINPNMGYIRFKARISIAEGQGFPKFNTFWGGRYWPEVKIWLDNDARKTNRSVATSAEDGPENFNAPPRKNARVEKKQARSTVLDSKTSNQKPDGVSGFLHSIAV
jgi:hypothetical protein